MEIDQAQGINTSMRPFERDWHDFLENKSPPKKEEDDAYKACTCGCQACQGTGWYRFGRSYKRCCIPCPVHYPNNE